jgi:hypothetical protein
MKMINFLINYFLNIILKIKNRNSNVDDTVLVIEIANDYVKYLKVKYKKPLKLTN